MKPIIHNAGAFYLQCGCVSIITVQISTELNSQYIFKLDTSEDLLDGLIPLVVDHKVNCKYPKLLKIPAINTSYNRAMSQDQLHLEHENS